MAQQQRPLVEAAELIQRQVDLRSHEGYAGIRVLENNEAVELAWKGAVPPAVSAAVARARAIAPVRVVRARYSLAELKAASATVREQFDKGGLIHGLMTDGTGNGLIVAVRPSADGFHNKAEVAASLPSLPVAVTVVERPPLEPISRNNDSAPWKGGATIINTRGFLCTSGFGVLAGGSPHLLSAGHCAIQVGDTFQDGSGERIGTVSRKTNHDQLLIPISSAGNSIYVGNRASNTTKRVTDWAPVVIGELLCQSGVTSAQEVGGPVCGLRVQFHYTDEEELVEARQIDGQQSARGGDSGGSVYSDRGDTVIAKGTSTRAGGPGFGFQDMDTANRDFGIQIPGGSGGGADVELFQHCDFGGWRVGFNGSRTVSTAQLQAAGGVDNDASSIRVRAGCTVRLFDDDDQAGASITVSGDDACFVDNGFNDALSSMQIDCGGGGAGVVFFQNFNFGGASGQPLDPGSYMLADLQARGIPNDWASSVRIPAGRSVTIFEHDGFTGRSWTLGADTPSFAALTPNANDQMSSLRVN